MVKARLYELNGEEKTLKEWSEESGINLSTLRSRLHYGYTLEQAIYTEKYAGGDTKRLPSENLKLIKDSDKRTKYDLKYAFYQCICGNIKEIQIDRVNNGVTQSCGCIRNKMTRELSTSHNMRYLPEYKIWIGIKTRCYNPSATGYDHYGGKGIKMCESWRDSFPTFYSDLGPRPSLQHSVERIDNNGDYEPNNCKWATRTEQANNRSNNHCLEYGGENLTIAEWANRLDITERTISKRLKRGWDVKKTLTKPSLRKNKND